MEDESPAIEEEATEPQEERPQEEAGVSAEAPATRRRRGPGFRLGLLLGALAGAASAVLLSPNSTEGVAPGGLRSRLREAAEEARAAAREAEERQRARFARLTEPDEGP